MAVLIGGLTTLKLKRRREPNVTGVRSEISLTTNVPQESYRKFFGIFFGSELDRLKTS